MFIHRITTHAPEASPRHHSSAASLGARRVTSHPPSLTGEEWRITLAVAQAAIPRGRTFPAGGLETVQRTERVLQGLPRAAVRRYRSLLHALDASTLPRYGRRFRSLPLEQRREHLIRLRSSKLAWLRSMLRLALLPIQYSHFDTDDYYETVGLRRHAEPPIQFETPRWHQQLTEGSKLDEDLSVECEVVVIGTGAGGAACAYELAKRGRAVLMLEEGALFDRRHMRGDPAEAFSKMYRNAGMTVAVGNAFIPVMAGKTVGGTTTVNSGTCYRAPDRVLGRWVHRYGLEELSPSRLAPYYERVETMLQVERAPAAYLGGVARVVARGADKLGWRHGPLPRNAPGCDGAGACAFGCPTGAKRSTDTSYVPAALQRGAQLISETTVHTILQEHGRAVGVVGTTTSGHQVIVRAQAVVVAAGTMFSPTLLRRNGISTGNRWLGRNLSIHPAAKLFGVFDEPIDMVRGAIPQGYGVEQFAEDGIMLEGASLPPVGTAFSLWDTGEEFSRIMDNYRNLALFGFLIQDRSRGRILPSPLGMARMLYYLEEQDLRRIHKGLVAVSEIMLAAGAREVIPFVHGVAPIRSWADLQAFRHVKLEASKLELTAYHPLGTCRVGTSPERSVLSPNHETWDVRRLFVVDGSAVPSSLGVNPQMTIMAMALRAGEIIDQMLED